MLSIVESARTKWPDMPDDVKIIETNTLSITFPVLDEQLFRRAWPWMIRRPTFRALTVRLEPIDSFWLGYNAEHNLLCVNFTGEHHAN